MLLHTLHPPTWTLVFLTFECQKALQYLKILCPLFAKYTNWHPDLSSHTQYDPCSTFSVWGLMEVPEYHLHWKDLQTSDHLQNQRG